MIKRIILFLILPCFLIALLLSLRGVSQIGYGDSYMTFLRDLSRLYDSWTLEIPDIPLINKIPIGDYNKEGLILAVLIKIANFFVGYLNMFIRTINIFTTICNVIIKIIGFFISIIRAVLDFVKRNTFISVLRLR